jgi:NADH:ubiquinone oxidoreductase subunit 5 (subunit L)/multisubunit Na+/H+ antiporter MnhA subunit
LRVSTRCGILSALHAAPFAAPQVDNPILHGESWMPLTALFLCIIVLALAGPALWLLRPHRAHWFAWLAATPPAAVFIWLAFQLPFVTGAASAASSASAAGQALVETYPWVPSLGLTLSLRLDGLSLLFALIVTGIGACIAYYTNYYFAGDEQQGYFYLLLFFFMASMLGLVLANDLLLLFVFWEGTSISSYLLIAFKRGYKSAVEGARRALIVTTAGGLAMLGGMILLGQAAGTFQIDAILARPDLATTAIFPWALGLIMLGAFTKSAQFPFHFWLPGAMAAPTPASAYLHSATMVKAGVYLLARLHPAFGDSALWFWPLFLVGGFTMVLGAVSAIRYRDMKAILAYTTISALGTMVMLLAFPTSEAAMIVVVTILAHALYKAPLFLMAGIVDHALGTRDLRNLAGLWRTMPWVAATAVIAGVSMAGVPPTWGFLAKELALDEYYHLWTHGGALGGAAASGASGTLDAGLIGLVGLVAVVIMALFSGAAIFTLLWEAFFRSRPDVAHHAEGHAEHHAPSFWFTFPALLLATVGAVTALAIGLFQPLLSAAAGAIAYGVAGTPVDKTLKLWHGWTPVMIMSLVIIAGAVVLVFLRRFLRAGLEMTPQKLNGTYIYDAIVDAIYGFAYRLTKLIQGGPMAPQAAVTLLAGVAVVFLAYWQVDWTTLNAFAESGAPIPIEFLIVAVALVAAIATVRAASRLSAIISLGVVGIAVALFFVFYSAPDLALTQLLIEVLTVILLVLVFFRVKPDAVAANEPLGRKVGRWALALGMGAFGAGLVLASSFYQVGPSISPYFLANSIPIGQGGNVVNVILVDTRGYDTLGEITVLGLAALGGYAVLQSPQLQSLRRQLTRRLRGLVAEGEQAAKESGHD